MKAFRYNSTNREDRKFNTTGMEKNPNKLNYYASNLQYAEAYKYICNEEGDVLYECELETVEIETPAFSAIFLIDMCISSFCQTYVAYIRITGSQSDKAA